MAQINRNKIKKEEFIAIKSEITDDGIVISTGGKKYKIAYPNEIWSKYPDTNKEFLLDNITFTHTCYLAPSYNKKGIVYSTAMPLFEPFAFKCTMYDIPSIALVDKQKTVDNIRKFFNSTFIFASYDTVMPDTTKKKKFNSKKTPTAIIPFTAGKESLLTLALCLEIGIRPIPVYIDEDPEHPETKHKNRIIQTIQEEYGIKIYTLLNEPGKKLRFEENDDNNWGIGTQLLTYVLELAPFAYQFDADYILFGNEYSCDEFTYDEEGFKSSFWFDQRSDSTKQLSAVSQIMTNNATEVASLVSPLYEIGIIKILHERYPALAKLQMSCFSDTEEGKEDVWCGNCPKCGWLYAFFKAHGIDTNKVGFKRDMFTKENIKHFSIFGGSEVYSKEALGEGVEEQALAFFMAAERGEKGELIDEFKKLPAYDEIKSNFKKIQKKYLSQYESVSLPYELKEKLMDIFEETFSGEFSPKDFRLKAVQQAEKKEDEKQAVVEEKA